MKTQIIIADRLGYVNDKAAQTWIKTLQEVGAMILGLPRSLGNEL